MVRVEAVPQGQEDRWLTVLNHGWQPMGIEPFTWDTLRYGRSSGRMRPGALYWALDGGDPVGTTAITMRTMRAIAACVCETHPGAVPHLLAEARRQAAAGGRRFVEAITPDNAAATGPIESEGFELVRRYPKLMWRLPYEPLRPARQMPIRRAETRDRDRLIELQHRGFLPDWGWVDATGTDWREGAERFVAEHLGESHTRILVAETDGEIAGMVAPSVRREFVRRTGHAEGYLNRGVVVLPRYKQQGIGSALLVAALRYLAEEGMRTASVWTFTWVDEPTPALQFYQRNGGRIIRTWLSLERQA